MTQGYRSFIFIALVISVEAITTPLHAGAPYHKQSFLATEFGGFFSKVAGEQNSTRSHPHHVSADLRCGQTAQVHSGTDKYEDCPASCPFFAQNRDDSAHCTFVCVPGNECAKWNPNKPIPDDIRGTKTCRGPVVEFCSEPKLDGTDTCARCQSGFSLHTDGKCHFSHWYLIIGVVVFIAVIVVFLLTWVIDMCCRESINEEQFALAQRYRSHAKIHMPIAPRIPEDTRAQDSRDEIPARERRKVWPMDTNLCTTDVAGPGMMLHFNFQAFLIFWPLTIAVTWTILACFYNELFYLGTRKFGTPRHNCILVAWGYETQQELMWTKVLFLVIVYFWTLVFCLLLAVHQNRLLQKVNAKQKTMQDFAAELKGLPKLKGSNLQVEDEIKRALEAATGKQVEGVSIAWEFTKDQDTVFKAISDETEARQAMLRGQPDEDDTDPTANMGPVRKRMYAVEKSLLGPDDSALDVDIVELLSGLESSESAFIVFTLETDKDEAIEKVRRDGGIKFSSTCNPEQCTLTLEPCNVEPAAVNWQNFGDSGLAAMLRRLMWGFCTVYIPALSIWFFVFYVPYAWSLYNFNYENGAQPPTYFALVFTIVVVGGNAIMYVVCDICAETLGFRFKDSKQTCYMLLYLFACMFNVFLDLVVTYWMCYDIAVGQDFRTYDGTRIAHIVPFTEQFETYAMQRMLAENAYRYAWPSTFLVPFLLEPIITVLMPYQVGKVIIRTHKEVRGACAEAYLAAFEFDTGRYADILLNVFLGILIFYFPGGYTWTLFYGMAFSHCVIYAFDHWRVINVIPALKIVSSQVDTAAQVTLGACCSMILMCLVFKANCETYSGYCLYDMKLITTCTIAGFAHFVVHCLLLAYVVPMMGKDVEDENPGQTFAETADNEPNTWFSTNPVHCLRSQHVHKHQPFCRFSAVGKEHLLEKNTEISCYFEDIEAEDESFTVSMSDIGGSLKKLGRSTTGTFSKFLSSRNLDEKR